MPVNLQMTRCLTISGEVILGAVILKFPRIIFERGGKRGQEQIVTKIDINPKPPQTTQDTSLENADIEVLIKPWPCIKLCRKTRLIFMKEIK